MATLGFLVVLFLYIAFNPPGDFEDEEDRAHAIRKHKQSLLVVLVLIGLATWTMFFW
jgi:hypothetical protein